MSPRRRTRARGLLAADRSPGTDRPFRVDRFFGAGRLRGIGRPFGGGPGGVAGWGLVSSAAAPVLLIGGWTVAAALQRDGFDAGTGTISALAARDADARWVMTAALAGTGLCHLVTAAALRRAPAAARTGLAAGGVGTLLVAAFPLPTGGGTSVPHAAAAGLAFGALSLWPALTGRRPDRLAAAALTVVLAAFVQQLAIDGPAVGRTERLAAAAQSLWPLATTLGARRTH